MVTSITNPTATVTPTVQNSTLSSTQPTTAPSTSTSNNTSTSLTALGQSIISSVTGSTININNLATQLTQATILPQQTLIDNKKAAADATISSIGQITSSANTFQS
jgi:hypothetical protein